MEEEKGEGVSSARASSSLPPSAPPFPSSHPPMEAKAAAAAADQRQRFAVELRPGETTIVSWKSLMKDSTKGSGSSQPAPAGAHPALESRISPPAIEPVECEPKDDEPPPNRFSAVIEKIERLYMGNQSSDEEEFDEVPDDDQYDTEDSFIDDAELDEYFQVDKLATKHNGFFVNRGNLERIEPNSSLTVAPKKRRRKESTKNMSEKDIQQMPIELGSKGNVRMKAAARNAPLVGKKSSPSRSLTPFGDKYLEGKFSKNMVNSSTMTCQKKSTDTAITSESLPSARMPNLDVLALPVEPKYLEKQKVGVIQSRDLGNRLRGASDSVDAMQQASRDKGVSSQTDSQPRKLLNDEKEIELPTKIRRREKNEPSELPDLNSPGSIYPVQPVKPSSRLKEVSGIRPKGTTLERAIRDLEKMVLVSRPPSLDVQETDTSQGVKKRLPREVKQKLAKVARLAASTGKIPEEELLDRLMGILGHLLQRKTLKRNLKEMIQQGFAAKKLKANRLEHVKKEVIEMIRTRIVPLKAKVAEQQDGSSDDFQDAFITEERRVLKAKCNMDDAIEDKICDLYDLYVEGMDEDLGPQIRKLYVELAELWPNGYMDNLGIKDAVYRAKERKRALYKQQKDHHRERIKRKRLHNYTVKIEETASLSAETRAGQDRPAIDSSGQFLMPAEKVTSNHQSVSLSSKASDHSASLNGSGHLHRLKHQDKVRRGINSSNRIADEGYKTASSLKKKLKRKSEVDMGEIHANPMKLHSIHSKEKEKHTAHKHSANPSAVVDHKPSLQSHGFQGSDRPS